jgi:glycosyltransferase involved in cell wall biosynthesis
LKISVVIHDFANNGLVRVYPILKVLQRRHDIEIVGSQLESSFFYPYRDEFTYSSFPYDPLHGIWSVVNRIESSISGDIIYAFKPRPFSLYPSVKNKLRSGRPLLVDIEDWELSWSSEFDYRSGLKTLRSIIRHPRRSFMNPNATTHAYVCEWLTKFADEVLVVSRWLQRRFGGVRLIHGADTAHFDPARFVKASVRKKLGLGGETLLLFTGQPASHKGLEDIIAALKLLKTRTVRLVIVGGDSKHAYLQRCFEAGGDQVAWLPFQPHSLMPEILAAADFVVLPQRRTPHATAQVPGKIFEAMAMAKPIIATAMSDLPEILDNDGLIVEPGQPKAIAMALERCLDDINGAHQMGERARARCQKLYSYDAMESILEGVLNRVS